MKYLSLAFILLFIVSLQNAHSQSIEQAEQFVAIELAQKMNGFQDDPATYYDDQEVIATARVVKIPDYYDTELMISSVNSIIREYSDMSYLYNWTKKDGILASIVTIDDVEGVVIMVYVAEHNVISLTTSLD